MKLSLPFLTAVLSLLPTTIAVTSPEFSLITVSSHAAYNNIHYGAVGYVNGTLVGGLQFQQTLPVGGTITDGVLSFLEMDPSDPIPAYFVHGAIGSWITLDVWTAVRQAEYSLNANDILQVAGRGTFYAGEAPTDGGYMFTRVFFNRAGKKVPKGFYEIKLKALYCDVTSCA